MNWGPKDWERLGTLLKEAREAQGLSRRALAEETGLSEKAIQTAEEGRVPSARWPKSVDVMASTLGWAPGSARAVLGGNLPQSAPEAPAVEPPMDAIVRRMTGNQVAMQAASLTRDADRLAASARQYAADLKDGKPAQGGAYQLAVAVADLLRQASRLDGMRDIAGLVNEEA